MGEFLLLGQSILMNARTNKYYFLLFPASSQNGLHHHHGHHHHKVDLLEAVGLGIGLLNRSEAIEWRHGGVRLEPGPHSEMPAAHFLTAVPDLGRQVKITLHPEDELLVAASTASEIALMTSIKQYGGTSGTLLAVKTGSQR